MIHLPTLPLKIALIGCGGIATRHVTRGYAAIKEAEPDLFLITALCDEAEEQNAALAEEIAKFQSEAPSSYTHLSKMLANEELDGADICTPHSDHHVSGVACLEARVNVLIEKPIGITIKASKLIIDAAERAGKIAATAENIRRQPGQRTAHWAINEAKLIGEPRLFFLQQAMWKASDEPPPWHWRVDKWMGGGGMVMDSGAHFCDTMRYIFGDPDTIYAQVRQLERWPHKKNDETVNDFREDTWIATITFASGLMGVWSWTMVAPGRPMTTVVYYGSEGCLMDRRDIFHGPHPGAEVIAADGTAKTLGDLQPEFLASLSDAERERLFPHGFEDGFALEVYDFLRAIADERAPEIDAVGGMKSKAIAEAIFESSYCGQAVKYADVLSGAVEGYQREIDEHWGIG